MSEVQVRPFRRADREQLTALVNAHVQAVVPGVSVSVNTVMSQLERDPGEFIVDPWVAERITLVAEQRGRVVAAAHLRRFGAGEELVGYIEVETNLAEGGRLAHLGGWADVGNLHVDEAYRAAGSPPGWSGRRPTGCAWPGWTGCSTTPGTTSRTVWPFWARSASASSLAPPAAGPIEAAPSTEGAHYALRSSVRPGSGADRTSSSTAPPAPSARRRSSSCSRSARR
jgi:hypothetical protein